MKMAKKILTRMLMNHWGGIDHQVICFHEYVNLFSGKSGSGKSTVMDALQVVLYGSIRNDFLNRAAEDTKNKRSVSGYLRGEQKDGTANRENMDFCSQIVLELKDTGTGAYVCIGVSFEVAAKDQDVNKYRFFSHTGSFPDDLYLSEGKFPYTHKRMQQLIGERSGRKEDSGPFQLNRMYPTQEAYLNTVNDVIFGLMDPGRFKVMEKSAIALRMTNGTGQFIRDYMFPRSKEDTMAAISEQLAAYREMKEQVENLEQEIAYLEEICQHDRRYTRAKAEQIAAEAALKVLEIEEKKVYLEAKEAEQAEAAAKLESYLQQEDRLKERLTEKREALSKLQAELLNSDFGRKKEQLAQLNETIRLCGHEAADWQTLAQRLKQWDTTEELSGYVSNPLRNLLMQTADGTVTEEGIQKLKRGLQETYASIMEERDDYKEELCGFTKEYREKKEILDDLKRDKKHYRKELKEAKRRLKENLSDRYQKPIRVEILADLFDVTDEAWRDAVEGCLGRIKFALVTEPQYALTAAEVFRGMKKKDYESVDLIHTEAIVRDQPNALPGTLYEAVATEIPYIDDCLKRYLGHIKKCETVKDLQQVRHGVTKDCYSYSNYIFRHLREQDYRYPSIGKKVSIRQIQELEEEITYLSEQMIRLEQEISVLNQVNELERLQAYEYERLSRLSQSAASLNAYNRKADQLEQEIRELEQGTRIAELKEQKQTLETEAEALETQKEQLQKDSIRLASRKGELDKDIKDQKEALEQLQKGFAPNPALTEQAVEAIRLGRANLLKRQHIQALEQLRETERTEEELRGNARMQFIKAFPSLDFGGMEQDNRQYDERLERCRKDYEPEYKAAFEQQYKLVYQMLRENVIAAIHGEMKAAKRHRREINSMLAKIRFSDSIYQIDILPAEDENRQFYEMLTAPELDLKVPDLHMEGQLSLGEDEFYQKYEQQIKRLTDKFMPPKDTDAKELASHRKNMAKYADYRTYLKFSMYEQAEAPDGNIRKNYVDDMAGRDSGGEGQNPKYVALFAGFAMLYMQQRRQDSKIRLVLLDEAFSKMDKERSEVCLHYARQLNLQLIVCVPDERLQSLVRNVDCVYAFCRKNNRISMIHIDKGNYMELLRGDAKEEEDERERDADSMADSEC